MTSTLGPELHYSYGWLPNTRYSMRLSDNYRRATGVIRDSSGVFGSFFVLVDKWPNRHPGIYVMVTARHVLDVANASFEAVMIDENRQEHAWPMHRADWHCSSDQARDIAVCGLPSDVEPAGAIVMGIDADCVTEQRPVELGQSVYFGGAISWRDQWHPPVPIIRSGTVAALDVPQLKWGTFGGPGHLIDTRVIGSGMSGGPCFVQFHVANLRQERERGWPKAWELLAARENRHREDLRDVLTFTHWWGMFVADDGKGSNVPIGIVVRTKEIREVLREKGLVATEQTGEADPHAPEPRAARDEPEDEFERFEDLTRRLVNVPKKEIDEKRKGD